MDTLRVQSGLRQGDLIRAKIRAKNVNGWGAYSQLNFVGAMIETTPLQMIKPSFSIPDSSLTQVHLLWTPLELGP